MDTTGKDFVDFWGWASEKGLMNPNTANALAAASRQVLKTEDNWEALDVTSINVDDLLARFRTKRKKDFKPESLSVYERRFRQALELFKQYNNDPANWRYKSQATANRRSKGERASDKKNQQEFEEDVDSANTASTGNTITFLEYPFRLRDGCIVKLRLPEDLKTAEVERLAVFMRALAIDVDDHDS